jgi:hypothetical protein
MTIKETFKLTLAFLIVVTVIFWMAVFIFMLLGYDFEIEALYAYLIAIGFLVVAIPLVSGVTELLGLFDN